MLILAGLGKVPAATVQKIVLYHVYAKGAVSESAARSLPVWGTRLQMANGQNLGVTNFSRFTGGTSVFLIDKAGSYFNARVIDGGQIPGMEPRPYLIYPECNFIEASPETPFFQIGETKYGRPILVRGFESHMSFADITKLLMVSFDSTLKANLSVGLPLDLMLYRNDDFAPFHERRITADDPYFEKISDSWSEALRNAFHSLPDYELDA